MYYFILPIGNNILAPWNEQSYNLLASMLKAILYYNKPHTVANIKRFYIHIYSMRKSFCRRNRENIRRQILLLLLLSTIIIKDFDYKVFDFPFSSGKFCWKIMWVHIIFQQNFVVDRYNTKEYLYICTRVGKKAIKNLISMFQLGSLFYPQKSHGVQSTKSYFANMNNWQYKVYRFFFFNILKIKIGYVEGRARIQYYTILLLLLLWTSLYPQNTSTE